ncbi:MAG: DUF1080 domain-containing protein [Lentisphaeraceae bacterium]|nr:DUF1080 domain-containing protein [Lentisphaeraceae bacterium]
MTKMKCVLLFLLVSLISVNAENVMLKTTKLLVDDPMTEETWKAHWKGLRGTWKWEGDSIKGIEIPEQNHHAGAGRIEDMESGVLELEFRMDDSRQLQFGYDYLTKEKKDHMMRASIDAKGLSVRAGKGWGKETRMKSIGKRVNMTFEPGKWYKGKIEFHKDHLIVHINDQMLFYGVALISQEAPKNRITLTARGTASFRNVKLWSGELKSDWGKTQKSLANKFPPAPEKGKKKKK